ncbi:MAG: hypothetical protein WA110_01480 [Anaerolineaceae bacterium]
MFWYLLAYVLFMTGAVLGILENGSELSLWFIGLGWVLDFTLNLLVLLKSRSLPRLFSSRGKVTVHILALVAVPVLMVFRAKANLPAFKLILALCVVLWSYSFIGLQSSHSNLSEKS